MIPPSRLRWIRVFLAGLIGSAAGWTVATAMLLAFAARGPLPPGGEILIPTTSIGAALLAAWLAWINWGRS
ncbi:hypothetical protein [Thermoflexus sp.]|uniref:hypothetical protein n=1 Tax=Thermoflexus sp. TaxID=1969742 RepID=UPI002605EEA9|nr:hypothetical protein [Thermoflexus sp.]MCX7690564.1 hypothetical protein [Thermoflexus sp.]